MKYSSLSLGLLLLVAMWEGCFLAQMSTTCPNICPLIFSPVCGSDGVSYDNSCLLEVASCNNPQQDITLIHRGQCSTGCPTTTCSDTIVPICGSDLQFFGNECYLELFNCNEKQSVEAVSQDICKNATECLQCSAGADNNTVCASDGLTYANECILQNVACLFPELNLVAVGAGACSSLETVQSLCPAACTRIFAPVCGSNGETFQNECHLLSQSCMSGDNITKVRNGPCSSNEIPTASPSPQASPSPSPSRTSVENCDATCPVVYDPVCGSDGVTYTTECFLTLAACQNPSLGLTIASRGPCPTNAVSASNCPTSCSNENATVCGSDGKSYQNECFIRFVACQTGENLTVGTSSECSPNCPGACANIAEEVCGSDGQTYLNNCVLEATACSSGMALTKVSDSACPLSK